MQGERFDHAVILARGASRRMGEPKGLVRLPGHEVCFLEMLLRAYAAVDIPVLVVAGPDGREHYAGIVQSQPGSQLLVADAAGDTARTIGLARRYLGPKPTHLWAHPVDVPGVGPATLRLLCAASRRQPQRVLRPFWRRRPGHPVVLPAIALAALDATLPSEGLLAETGRMNEVLAGLEAAGQRGLGTLEVEDPNVVRDYDAPEDLVPRPACDEEKQRPEGRE